MHSEEFYKCNGIWIHCGKEAGYLIPLKIIDEINGTICIRGILKKIEPISKLQMINEVEQ